MNKLGIAAVAGALVVGGVIGAALNDGAPSTSLPDIRRFHIDELHAKMVEPSREASRAFEKSLEPLKKIVIVGRKTDDFSGNLVSLAGSRPYAAGLFKLLPGNADKAARLRSGSEVFLICEPPYRSSAERVAANECDLP